MPIQSPLLLLLPLSLLLPFAAAAPFRSQTTTHTPTPGLFYGTAIGPPGTPPVIPPPPAYETTPITTPIVLPPPPYETSLLPAPTTHLTYRVTLSTNSHPVLGLPTSGVGAVVPSTLVTTTSASASPTMVVLGASISEPFPALSILAPTTTATEPFPALSILAPTTTSDPFPALSILLPPMLSLSSLLASTSTPAVPTTTSDPFPALSILLPPMLSLSSLLAAPTPVPVSSSITPAAPAPAAPSSSSQLVTIQSGDTLESIAKAHNVGLCDLVLANPAIKDPNLILVGDVLVLPAAEGKGDKGDMSCLTQHS
ncbi:hypothetical protein GMOD_00008858 [Pyrenophora seminiperda CCB06]|uniref:LysM domain-containing protein n=1 Tax=Pyrenophora seminiperda CCB06 TaxID=1302712 RepID=A0A3M7M6A2_9PLEO|nr:hypothetical protein GMOD_00008858 [Pyrenophora seminiperda CCB06]